MSQGRDFLNNVAIPSLSQRMTADDMVYIIGKNPNYDYSIDFKKSITTDINPEVYPDLIDDICQSKVISDTASAVIFIGVYEFLKSPVTAMVEIQRILKKGGLLLAALPGKGYWPAPGETGARVNLPLVIQYLENFKIHQMSCFYADNNELESCIVLAEKI